MQVFADIEELWARPFDAHKVMVSRQDHAPAAWKDSKWFRPGPQMSVMVLDCSRLDWDIQEIVRGLDEGRFSYADLLFDLCLVPPGEIDDTLPSEWNHLERYEPGFTKLIHYTVVPTQPWKNDENPLRDLWRSAYREAVAAGAIVPDEVQSLARRGGIKSALVDDLEELPRRRFPTASVADLELAAAYARIDALEGRTIKGRSHQALSQFRPVVDSLRRNADRGRLIAAADRTANRLRRALR
jgi:hypothetical protein